MAIEAISFPDAGVLRLNSEGRNPNAGSELRVLRQAVHDLQNSGYGGESELSIAFDSATRKNVVQIVDRETKEVLSQIPSKDVIALARYYKALENVKA